MRKLKKAIWPYKITVKGSFSDYKQNLQINDIVTWLGENLGLFKDQWTVVYSHDRTDFYFKDDRNATLFALRWS